VPLAVFAGLSRALSAEVGQLDAEVRVSERTVFEGDTVSVVLRLRNRGAAPLMARVEREPPGTFAPALLLVPPAGLSG